MRAIVGFLIDFRCLTSAMRMLLLRLFVDALDELAVGRFAQPAEANR
jgi:hypothetical protein